MWNGEILAQISRGARLTLRVMKCNETKEKKFAVSRICFANHNVAAYDTTIEKVGGEETTGYR